MDTITHGIVGALAGKAFFAGPDVPAGPHGGKLDVAQSSITACAAILACTCGSVFPDIDVFAAPLAGNPLGRMEWHRNITHSMLMLPVWAVLLAAVSLPLARLLRLKTPSYQRMVAIYAVGLASHIFLDLVTSYGTMVWSPLSYSRVSWDSIFILDLILTSIAMVPQLAAWCFRDPGKFERHAVIALAIVTMGAFGGYALAKSAGYAFSIWVIVIVDAVVAAVLFLPLFQGAGFRWSRASWCRVGLAVLCTYVGLATVLHRKALADVNSFVAGRQLHGEKIAAVPLPPNLTHWSGLISTPEGVWRTTFHEPGGIIERTQFYSDSQADGYVEEAKKLHDVQVYLWFARFPIWNVRRSEGQTVVEISDVRFFREDVPEPSGADQRSQGTTGVRPGSSGFTFEVVFDAGGTVFSSGFRRP